MGQAPTAQTDESLAATAARRGSRPEVELARRAFADLYQRHGPPLLAYLKARVAPADAEDVLQEVCLRVWQHLPQNFAGGNFRAWLYQIAANYLIDRGRKKKPGRLADEGSVPDRRPGDPARHLVARERQELLAICLEKLAPRAGELVKARLAGESYDNVCPRLGLSAAQAHKLFHQAKDELQKCVGREAP
jgi:RNA polymerase sigma-70 factor (ECF subfamily)